MKKLILISSIILSSCSSIFDYSYAPVFDRVDEFDGKKNSTIYISGQIFDGRCKNDSGDIYEFYVYFHEDNDTPLFYVSLITSEWKFIDSIEVRLINESFKLIYSKGLFDWKRDIINSPYTLKESNYILYTKKHDDFLKQLAEKDLYDPNIEGKYITFVARISTTDNRYTNEKISCFSNGKIIKAYDRLGSCRMYSILV